MENIFHRKKGITAAMERGRATVISTKEEKAAATVAAKAIAMRVVKAAAMTKRQRTRDENGRSHTELEH